MEFNNGDRVQVTDDAGKLLRGSVIGRVPHHTGAWAVVVDDHAECLGGIQIWADCRMMYVASTMRVQGFVNVYSDGHMSSVFKTQGIADEANKQRHNTRICCAYVDGEGSLEPAASRC